MRTALAAGPDDVSLTAVAYSAAPEFTAGQADAELSVLVRTAPAAYGPEGPLSLATVEYERPLASVKHVGEVAKTHFLREARTRRFDDAAFVDRRGRLSEATIWNLAFWDGESVLRPEADVLTGTLMGTVRRRLDRLGVPQRQREITPADLPALRGAVVLNSWIPGVPVHRVGSVPLPAAPAFVDLLHRAHEVEPPASP